MILVGIFHDFPAFAPCLIASLCCSLAFFVVLFVLRETVPKKGSEVVKSSKYSEAGAATENSFRKLLDNRNFVITSIMFAIGNFLFQTLATMCVFEVIRQTFTKR